MWWSVVVCGGGVLVWCVMWCVEVWWGVIRSGRVW